MFLDAIHYNVRENESSKYWLMVLNQLKDIGLEDVLIFSIDSLPSFSQAIEVVYAKAEIQKCIIHQIRNSTKYVSYKDIKELMRDLKTIYKAPTEELALSNLDYFEEKWGTKYPMCVSSWRNNWAELSTYFKYPQEMRTIIYTTNAMENFNRQLRKVTKSKTIFLDSP